MAPGPDTAGRKIYVIARVIDGGSRRELAIQHPQGIHSFLFHLFRDATLSPCEDLRRGRNAVFQHDVGGRFNGHLAPVHGRQVRAGAFCELHKGRHRCTLRLLGRSRGGTKAYQASMCSIGMESVRCVTGSYPRSSVRTYPPNDSSSRKCRVGRKGGALRCTFIHFQTWAKHKH